MKICLILAICFMCTAWVSGYPSLENAQIDNDSHDTEIGSFILSNEKESSMPQLECKIQSF